MALAETNHDFAMGDSAENTREIAGQIVASLKSLRKLPAPFAADSLASQLALLLLPFLQGVPDAQRVDRLQTALELVADRLSLDQEVVYRHVFLKPVHRGLGQRRDAAFTELPKKVGFRERTSPKTVTGIEDRMLPVIAGVLLSLDFAAQLDEEHPVSRRHRPNVSGSSFEQHYYELLVNIDDSDPRRQIDKRIIKVRALLPDQRVLAAPCFSKRTPITPVQGSPIALSNGHTHLGTFPDLTSGTAADWWTHLIYLGRRQAPGQFVTVEFQEEYYDEGTTERHPYVTLYSRYDSLQTICLGIRVPRERIKEVTAEAREIEDPHSDPRLLDAVEVSVQADGWIRHIFPNCVRGVQYGIFLEDFDLYKFIK